MDRNNNQEQVKLSRDLERRKKRESDRKEYRERLRKHGNRNRLLGIGAAIGLVACVAGAWAYENARTFEQYSILWETEMEQNQNSRCVSWGNYVLLYSESGMSCLQGDGTVCWSVSYEMLDPAVVIQGDYGLIMDCKGTDFLIVNKEKGVTGNGETPYIISQGQIATQGTAALVCENEDISYIYYYKSTGDRLDIEIKATMERVGYPLSMAISPDGKSLVVSYLYVEGGAMQNKLVFYDFSSETKETVAGTFSQYAETDTIIPKLMFTDNGHVIAIGDNCLSFYSIDLSGKGRIPSLTKEISLNYQIISMFAENGCVGLVYEKREGDEAAVTSQEIIKMLTMYDGTGEVVFEQEISFHYNNIIYNGTYIVLYNDVECKIYGKNGAVKYENTFLNGISQIVPGSSAREFYLVMSDKIQKIRLL